jgi:hypothetical protein
MPALHNSHFLPQKFCDKEVEWAIYMRIIKVCQFFYCFHFCVGCLATKSVSCLISSMLLFPNIFSSLGLCHHSPLCPYNLILIFINLFSPGLIVLPLSLLVCDQVPSPYINVSVWHTCKSETFSFIMWLFPTCGILVTKHSIFFFIQTFLILATRH